MRRWERTLGKKKGKSRTKLWSRLNESEADFPVGSPEWATYSELGILRTLPVTTQISMYHPPDLPLVLPEQCGSIPCLFCFKRVSNRRSSEQPGRFSKAPTRSGPRNDWCCSLSQVTRLSLCPPWSPHVQNPHYLYTLKLLRNSTPHVPRTQLFSNLHHPAPSHDQEMMQKSLSYQQKCHNQTSLVVQWLRICLPMQETWVWSLAWEDSTYHGTTKPVCYNYWAYTLEMPWPPYSRLWGSSSDSHHNSFLSHMFKSVISLGTHITLSGSES